MEIKLNLIPDYRREEILNLKKFKLVLRVGMIFFIYTAMFFSFLFFLSYVLEMNIKSLDNNPETKKNEQEYAKITDFNKKFSDINSQIDAVFGLKNDQLYWSNLLVKLSDRVLPGVSISGLSTKNYAVFVAGKADNRDNLILFKANLEKEDCFFEVNLPLSNLVSQENVDFQMDFKIKQDCLKNK